MGGGGKINRPSKTPIIFFLEQPSSVSVMNVIFLPFLVLCCLMVLRATFCQNLTTVSSLEVKYFLQAFLFYDPVLRRKWVLPEMHYSKNEHSK